MPRLFRARADRPPSVSHSGYVTLGAPLAEDGSQMAKAGFKGKLARVNMWSRMLDIRSEIPKQVREQRRQPETQGGWNG